jgi:hypothetical protein
MENKFYNSTDTLMDGERYQLKLGLKPEDNLSVFK